MNKKQFNIYNFVIDKINLDDIKKSINLFSVYDYESVILEIKECNFEVSNLPIIIELFAQKQLIVIGVKTDNIEILEFAKFSNLAIFKNDDLKQENIFNTNLFNTKPKVIYSDISNGEQIYTKNTDLVILGDVRDGAEILSDKNIYVYSGGYGKIFAGINNKNAKIFINFFAAKLICINGVYREFKTTPKEYLNKAIEITLNNNKLDFKILE